MPSRMRIPPPANSALRLKRRPTTLLGTQFEQFVTSVDHWIAFVLLGIIGGNMIREALSKDEGKLDGSLAFKTMLLLAIATSIDALAVGITFAFLPGTRIVPAVALKGI